MYIKHYLKALGLTAAASARDAAIRQKIFVTMSIISNEEMNDIMQVVIS